ncbi:MAG TPA: hypothetical protein VKQ27_19675, partial [Acetobacteraceae bacterium]|nr:hypothetical protein [Acetobacteraceae bacterium]
SAFRLSRQRSPGWQASLSARNPQLHIAPIQELGQTFGISSESSKMLETTPFADRPNLDVLPSAASRPAEDRRILTDFARDQDRAR